jgi:hypothetical protein
MSDDDKNSFCHTVAQKIKDELSNPEFMKLLEVTNEIGKLVFKLEKRYDLPNTDKVGMSWDPDECTLMLLDYIQKRIPDAPELPELEALIKEEIVLRRKYKESKGIHTVTH